jgi:hypothetical protein
MKQFKLLLLFIAASPLMLFCLVTWILVCIEDRMKRKYTKLSCGLVDGKDITIEPEILWLFYGRTFDFPGDWQRLRKNDLERMDAKLQHIKMAVSLAVEEKYKKADADELAIHLFLAKETLVHADLRLAVLEGMLEEEGI